MKSLALSSLMIAALAGCHDSVLLDEHEQVLETFDVELSAQRVVLTPGNRATLRIELSRDDESIPVELVAFGGNDIVATVSLPVVTDKPATLTVQAAAKAKAQDVVVKVEAKTPDGAVAVTEVLVNVQVPTAPVAGAEEYAPGVIGEPRTFVFSGQEIKAVVINGLAIAHGDVVVGDVLALEASSLYAATCNFGFHTDFACSPWSDGVFGYSFADNWGDAAENARMRALILDAIHEWESLTGLRFAHRNYGEYVEFRRGDGCSSSSAGRAVTTWFDSQWIQLNNHGCDHKGVIMHEIGHALGLYHEHVRNDRNSFVTVDFGRVRDGHLHDFFQIGDFLIDRGPYDFDSIMHYGRSAFARNEAACLGGDIGQCTVRPHDPTMAIGQRDHLSEGDILGAYLLYPPAYRIVGATDGSTDDRFWLSLAYDIEAPDARHMVWTSNRIAGTIGTGHSLELRASAVPSGTHVITASMVINGVTVTSRSITVTVGNSPPAVTVAATNGRTDQDLNRSFTLAAAVSDVEDGLCPIGRCRYTWTPTPTFGGATNRTAIYSFDTVGPRTLSVAVEDYGGAVTTASITVNIVNSAPVATITRPSSAITVSSGVTVALEGSATDINNTATGTIACAALRWTSSRTGDTFTPSTGCTPTVAFSGTGARTISLVATDPQGMASVPATVAITVNACSGTCGPTTYMTLGEPDWEMSGLPVYFRESTVPIRLSIGHALAPARSPITYRLSARRIGTTTRLTIRSGSVTVTSPTAPVNVDFNWVVASTIDYWSLCDNPENFRNYELLLEATDSTGVRTTHSVTVKLGCALI